MNISLYDCTIREAKLFYKAGYKENDIRILAEGLASAKVDYIDVGYLTEANKQEGFAVYSSLNSVENLLPEVEAVKWVASIRLDGNEMDLLSARCGKIDAVRFAVPFRDVKTLKTYVSLIKNKGYDVICELDNTFSYKDKELLEMIEAANESGVSQLTISDKSGRIHQDDLHRVYYLLANNLKREIRIGARLSDAYKGAYPMAQKLSELSREEKREIVLEGTLYGIGDFQGNLCLEAMADYINEFYGGNYELDSFYALIDEHIYPIAGRNTWGYNPVYSIAARYKLDSDYAQYLLERDVPLVKIHTSLKELAKTQEYEAFDELVAEKVFQNIK